MKQNIIMIVILIALFFFGLLIYDFSDQLDNKLTKHDWYIIENNHLDVMTFKNNQFSYYEVESGNAIGDFDLCSTYRFNRSINVIKLNCTSNSNKLYIASYDDNELTLTINGEEKTFYSTEELAYIEDFENDNELSNKEYNDLINIDFNKYTYTTVDEIVSLYKSKKTKYVAFINSDVTYRNVLNYKALDTLLSKNEIVVIGSKDLAINETKKLNNISSKYFNEETESYIKDQIDVYQIGNKKVKLIKTIDVSSIKEAENYNNI